jgi:hypothetical protein
MTLFPLIVPHPLVGGVLVSLFGSMSDVLRRKY